MIIVFLLTSCAPIKDNNAEYTNSSISINDVPMAEELQKWEVDEIYDLKARIENISLSDCQVFFTAEMTKFLDDYDDVNLEHLIITQDNLSVIEGQNKKSLYNLCFDIQIKIDLSKIDFKEAENIAEKALAYLETFSYYNLKAKECVINILDMNEKKIHDISSTHSIMSETMFAEQSKEEYAVQTLVFEYFKENKHFVLRKFGIKNDIDELYIEYSVADDFFDFNNTENSIANLKQIALEIKDYLIVSDVAKEYMEQQNITKIIISFNNGIFDNSYLEIPFEL